MRPIGRTVTMKIVDLDDHHLSLYFSCLEDWSDEAKESGPQKEIWYRKMKDHGLRVKLALDDQDIVGGMIQYVPIEYSSAEGTDLYFINCIWVHGHKQGRGDFQRKGMGKALLLAAEADAQSLGVKGIAAWGLILPVWMRASWFKKQGYRVVDREGIIAQLWKPFSADAVAPKWVRQKAHPPLDPNKVTVTAFCNGWCPAQNLVYERAKRVASDPLLADKVVFRKVNTFDRDEFLRWGISDALFINRKQVRTGPPPSYERIRKLIHRKAKRVKLPPTGNGA
jgi:GNAT superfamily N-acetyltransferase